MIHFQEQSILLGGVYTLEKPIREDEAGTLFTGAGPDGERLLIKLAREEQPVAAWRRLRQLSHPHLLAVRNLASSEVEGNSYVYAVFEHPDDVLASALAQGPLSEAESAAVEAAALAGLRGLHGQGLVHGAVDADHIVASGDVVKLSTETVRESDDAEDRAEDLRQLRALMRRLRPAAAETMSVQASRGFPRWVLAALAILLVLVAVLNLRRKTAGIPAKPAAPAAIQPAAPVVASAPAPAPGMWRVIAFTYRSRDMAAKKAKQINERWPDLRAGVFSPKRLDGYYLVALGDGMNREEAARLQRKARSLGLPRDTFMQNYSE